MKLRTIKDANNISGRKILLRVDYDITEDKKEDIVNHDRFKYALKTINFLIKQKPSEIFILAHKGRPGGVRVSELSLEDIAKSLFDVLNGANFCKKNIDTFPVFSFELSKVRITVFENLRFFYGEEKNSIKFAKALSKFGDIYINDAFAVSHRKHASVASLPNFLPSYAGLRLLKEVDVLSKSLRKPKRPLCLILGGIKLKTKISLINKLLSVADYILTGSGIAVSFYRQLGIDIGNSIYDDSVNKAVRKILQKPYNSMLGDYDSFEILLDYEGVNLSSYKYIKSLQSRIILPVDVLTGDKNKKRKKVEIIKKDSRLSIGDMAIFDIGPKTIELYKKIIKRSGTIIWNGPMGLFENRLFANGSIEIAKAVASSRSKTIIGGGDTIELIEGEHIEVRRNVFVSSGGGAMLEFLINPYLPGIQPLILNQ